MLTAEHLPRALFIGVEYAGHASRFATLRACTSRDPRIRPNYRAVRGWAEHGQIERLTALPPPVRGRLRGVWDARVLATLPRPDVIWSSINEVAAPWLWSQLPPLRRPLVLDLDATSEQMEGMSELYWKRQPRSGLHGRASKLVERAVWRSALMFTPWSRWAADGLRAAGVPDSRIRVVPPGVDLDLWRNEQRKVPLGRPVRLLFVGGDFERKGGPLLMDALRARPGQFELDIVTRDPVSVTAAGVCVHRAEPGSSTLRDLYARADVFALPTRAECFGIASVEALAAGLPVVMGDVGGARDIVDDGVNGWLIPPTLPGIVAALDRIDEQRAVLPAIGGLARTKAVSTFDASETCGRIVDLMLEAVRQSRGHSAVNSTMHRGA